MKACTVHNNTTRQSVPTFVMGDLTGDGDDVANRVLFGVSGRIVVIRSVTLNAIVGSNARNKPL
jgi:hypothetical protein